MPRKSTASATGAADPAATPAMSASTAPSNIDGDTSIMSVATDVSPSSKPPRTSTKADKGDADGTGIDDLLLPRTLTSRLARGTLPPNTSIQKDALLALTKAASVFISYLASQANEATTKKTIGPQDVLKAITEIEMAGVMGLGEVGPDGKVGGRLERELEVWETVVRGKRKGYREKVKQRESGVGEEGEGDGDGEEREAKRARVEEDVDAGGGGGEGGGAIRTESYDGALSFGEQRQQAMEAQDPEQRPHTNGAPKDLAGDDLHDDGGEDDGYDDDGASADGDETQPDEEDDPEDDEEEEPAPDEDEELDGFGPDDQLRHEMNGEETADDSD